MTTKRDDGGPAFPNPTEEKLYNRVSGERLNAGLTIRDWFAGQAVKSFFASCSDMPRCAKLAYEAADALIAERNKP